VKFYFNIEEHMM